MNHSRSIKFFAIAIWCFHSATCWAEILQAGATGHFSYADDTPAVPRTITVWYHCPDDLSDETEVVFVMHGTKRNGADYRDNWIEIANKYSFLVLVPEFSKHDYPKTIHYQFGNVRNQDGTLLPASEWSLTAIDRVFDHVIAEQKLAAKNYVIFGHSAGAQFVHRMILLYPEARARLAIAANAGSYTMPNEDIPYPYGLKESPSSTESLRKSFQKRMVVLLGQEDTDPGHRYLPRTSEAMSQGPHRLQRGISFFGSAQRSAVEYGIKLNWQLITVPKVGHENAKMAIAAAELVRIAR